MSTNLIAESRRKLAGWRAKHGDEAFARGLEVGIDSGNGVAYAGGVMRNYDPERDAARGGAGFGGGRRDDYDPEDDLPLLFPKKDGTVEMISRRDYAAGQRPSGQRASA